MSISELADKYFEQINIECVDYVAVDDAVSDAAYLTLDLPTEMLKEYQKLKGSRKKLPDGARFWKELGLANKLQKSGKRPDRTYEPLSDVLDYLKGDVWAEFYHFSPNPDRINLRITEVPEFHPE